MPLSPNEAADALNDITRTERKSAMAYGYHAAAPHFFLWGAIWIAEYGGVYFNPRLGPLFPVLSVVGLVGSFIIGWRMKGARRSNYGWRYGATALALFLFISALFAIFPPKSGAQIGAFFPLLVALAYVLSGIWTGALRMAVLGLAVGILTCVGYFYFHPTFMLWMALVGGGALVLGGLWLRRV
jgi:hypothetical protein